MKHLNIICLLCLTMLVIGHPVAAVPLVWGEWEWDHDQPAHLVVSPGESGVPFTQAEYLGGGLADATIRIQLWYQDDNLEDPQPPAPVPDFPAEDIWLEVPGMMSCPSLANPDGDTDAEGWFTFSLPPAMGGWADPDGTDPYPYVMLMGSPLYELNGPPIRPAILFNSPDINGDGQISLPDLGLFSTDYFGSYSFRSDFFWDGVLNLSDVGRLAASFGDGCP